VHAVPAEELQTQSVLERRVYAAALHRLRLDDRIDSILDPFMVLARALDKFDRRVRVLFGGGKERDP
jgi:hypothetical protein